MLTKDVENLHKCFKSAYVKRWHSEPVLKEQTVGQHTFNMILIANAIGLQLTRQPQIYEMIISHDLGEGRFGDIPYLAKKEFKMMGFQFQIENLENNEIQDIFPQHYRFDVEDHHHQFVSLIDMLELLIYVSRETLMGNRALSHVKKTAIAVITERHKALEAIYIDTQNTELLPCLNNLLTLFHEVVASCVMFRDLHNG